VRNIAIIPARSGSKGLKDKNIKLLNNKPLIGYTIDAAKNSNLFDEIYVSTNSEHYAQIASDLGANVPFLRSDDLSSDTASSWEVIKDTLIKYRKLGEEFNTVALLQPTSPLRNDRDIINSFNVMNNKEANAVVSVCEVDHSPLWTNVLPKDHSLEGFLNEELIQTPRQHLSTHYRINGAIYLVKTDYLMSIDNIYKEKCFATVMSKVNSVDIDDIVDFKLAEALMNDKLSKA
jgi:CMP-N,N'-diacetyllegionaminic acid synthase